ncbi:MAG TPA: hypothetical protein VHC47_14360, partial [Mucilaginibacter sp.]|nr:hypothetical protein [Mucilaginibacter sp.]
MPSELIFITGFLVFIFMMMALDLGLFGKAEKPVTMKEAAIMSGVWVSLALVFYFLIYRYGHLLHHVDTFAALKEINVKNFHHLKLNPADFQASLHIYQKNLALEFITGYVVEYALSVDNIFVMVLIFTAFAVAPRYYHKVLLWGILGAIVMRFLFIFLGATLISQFHWILYLFGAFLVYTGIKLFRSEGAEVHPESNPVVKWFRKVMPVT